MKKVTKASKNIYIYIVIGNMSYLDMSSDTSRISLKSNTLEPMSHNFVIIPVYSVS